MPTGDTTERYAVLVLRLGTAALFLWFGFTQLISPDQWTSWVPAWATALTHLDAGTIVLLNGGFELIGGVFLALGLFTRIAALVLGLHLFVILFDIGYGAIAVRDMAIAISSIALSLFPPDEWTLDRTL